MRNLVILCFISLGLSSCSKVDDININDLKGEWFVTPAKGVVEDSWQSYTFKNDTLCVIRISHAMNGGDTTYNRTYKLSYNKDLITLYNEKNIYTEQYKIISLSNKNMNWVNGSPLDGNTDKNLYKK